MDALQPALETQCDHRIDGVAINAVYLIELFHFSVHRQVFLRKAASQQEAG
jgi:hypothetical protein